MAANTKRKTTTVPAPIPVLCPFPIPIPELPPFLFKLSHTSIVPSIPWLLYQDCRRIYFNFTLLVSWMNEHSRANYQKSFFLLTQCFSILSRWHFLGFCFMNYEQSTSPWYLNLFGNIYLAAVTKRKTATENGRPRWTLYLDRMTRWVEVRWCRLQRGRCLQSWSEKYKNGCASHLLTRFRFLPRPKQIGTLSFSTKATAPCIKR